MGFSPVKDPTGVNNYENDNKNIHIYSIDNGIRIICDTDVDICIWTIEGQLVERLELKAEREKEIRLAKGVYVVNGEKVIVK